MTFELLGRNDAMRLMKLAVHPALKQYRRAMQGFEEAMRSQVGHTVPSKGFALHGTDDLVSVLEDARLEASRMGLQGQHGGGVYWWKGYPRERFLTGPESEGIVTSLENLPEKLPQMRNIYSNKLAPFELRTGPGNYKLRPKDTAVIDMPRAESDYLKELAQEQGLRVTDSAVFNQALEDFRAKNMLAQGKTPSKAPMSDKEIIDLYKKRMKTPGSGGGTRDLEAARATHDPTLAREMSTYMSL